MGQEGDKFLLLLLNCSRDGRKDRPFTIILRAISQDTYVRWLPGEIFVHEKYMRHSSIQESRTIYIRDPDEFTDLRKGTDNIPVSCSLPSTARSPKSAVAGLRWAYVTPPGHVSYRANGGAELLLGLWTGFSVLQFSIDNKWTLTIVLAHCVNPSNSDPRNRKIMMETLIASIDPDHPDHVSVDTSINACYERPDPANAPSLKSQLGFQYDPIPGLATLEPQPNGLHEVKIHLDKASDITFETPP